MKKWIPWLVTALLAVWVVAGFRPIKSKQGFDTGAFGQLPALLNGRVQPLDSVARNALLQIRARQTVQLEKRKSMPATEWLLELMMKPELADTRPVFRIDHPELLGMLELPQTNKFFSFIQLRPHLEDVWTQAKTVDEKEAQLRTPFERQVLQLFNAVVVYQSLRLSVQPDGTEDFTKELQEYRAAIGPGVEAVRASEAGK